VAPFVFGVEVESPAVVDHREAVEAVWIPLSVWCDPVKHSLRTVPGRPTNWLFPAIDLNGVPVWGFTYRLATDWLGLLPEQSSIEEAGFEMASRVLDFLVSRGLTLKRSWENQAAQPGAGEGQAVKVATVEGAIPMGLVVAQFTVPDERFPSLNLLEIRPDYIRVVELAFEEYLILASS
jgi:hypothetical protein